jgi:hypothetical protein
MDRELESVPKAPEGRSELPGQTLTRSVSEDSASDCLADGSGSDQGVRNASVNRSRIRRGGHRVGLLDDGEASHGLALGVRPADDQARGTRHDDRSARDRYRADAVEGIGGGDGDLRQEETVRRQEQQVSQEAWVSSGGLGQGDPCDQRSRPQDVPKPWTQAGGSNLPEEVKASAREKQHSSRHRDQYGRPTGHDEYTRLEVPRPNHGLTTVVVS